MPDFTRPSDDEMTNAEVEEAKVEEEALVALSTMKIDGTGPTEDGKETWRTAQWNESSDITMSSESSCTSRWPTGQCQLVKVRAHDSWT
jgi:hypothetical protein